MHLVNFSQMEFKIGKWMFSYSLFWPDVSGCLTKTTGHVGASIEKLFTEEKALKTRVNES